MKTRLEILCDVHGHQGGAMSPYTSSIIIKYGDIPNVKRDTATLFEIHARQGASLLIDAIAECSGMVCNELQLKPAERALLISNLVQELEDALLERI